ncbi:hypothetical protein CPC08DRAFT_804653 [Agrocybe pediades]|nr:hypothetical protein CPC08DRAFT_804653 [Agrocybe pediades]
MVDSAKYSGLKEKYERDGYVIVPDLIDPADWTDLEGACEHAVSRTREGAWRYRRTVGRQFPPYGEDDPDSWGVQHVMHPEMGEKAFVRWYTSPRLLEVVKVLLGCEERDLQMELFNLLINPVSHDFALRWHRDDIREDATIEEEQKALDIWHFGVQWNTALYIDSCLYVVPGSHKIPRTDEQRVNSSGQVPENPLDMPGSIRVTLQPGESVFYNQNILHCATYNSKAKRATLHACIGDTKGGTTRARNILQHELQWMKGEEFAKTIPNEVGRGMLKNLIGMYDESRKDGKDEIVYSLKN